MDFFSFMADRYEVGDIVEMDRARRFPPAAALFNRVSDGILGLVLILRPSFTRFVPLVACR